MTKHWVRDVFISDPAQYLANGNHQSGNAILYNFLAVAGWNQIWECDGEAGAVLDPNHVPDGDVQLASLVSWTEYPSATGVALSKDTTTVYSGVRSLKVEVDAAGKGVDSAALTAMQNVVSFTTGTGDSLSGPTGREMTYTDNTSRFSPAHLGSYLYTTGQSDPNNDGEFVISRILSVYSARFENPVGSPFVYGASPTYSYQIRTRYELEVALATDVDVEVQVDEGSAIFQTVGTIPANGGVFTLYSLRAGNGFFFRRTGSGTSQVRFVAQGAGTFYVGGLRVFHSVWGKPALIKQGTDGILTNPDLFSTGGSFTPDASDIGRHLFVWDTTNNKNSGCYEIVADLGGGVVQVDLRSGTAAFTTQSGLRWRVVQVDTMAYPNAAGTYGGLPTPTVQYYAGFAFESPHTSKWRFFLRQSQFGTYKGSVVWSSPIDTDFNFATGMFYKTGPSTLRNRQSDWYSINTGGTGQHMWRGGSSYTTSPHTSRIFLMVDEDGAFFNFFQWDGFGLHGCHLHGYLGSDLPGIESCYLFSKWEGRDAVSECYFDANSSRFSYAGTTYDRNGQAVSSCLAQLGFGTSPADATEVETQSNAGANPWSGREWLRPLILWRDFDMLSDMAALQSADVGIYQGRANMAELTTFDSNSKLHLVSGLVWDWSGETLGV